MTRAPFRAPALTALAALCVSLPAVASATTLRIEFTGLDLVYNGSELCDAVNCSDPRAGKYTDADALTTLTIGLDEDDDGDIDAPVALVSDIFADVDLGLLAIPVGGGAVSGGPGYIDILTSSGIPGYGIGLTIESWGISYLPTEPDGPYYLFGYGTVDSFISQVLPDGIEAHRPAYFSFSSQIAPGSVKDDGEYVTAFTTSVTGEIVTSVPEPGTASLLGLGLLGLAAGGSPRRRAATR